MALDEKYVEAVVICVGVLEIDRNLKLMREVLRRPLTTEEAMNLLRFIAGRIPELDQDAVRAALLGERPKRGRGRPKGQSAQKSSKLLGPYYLLWCKGMRKMEFYREWIPADRQSPIERREYFRNTLRRTFQRWDKDPDMQRRVKDASTINRADAIRRKFTPPRRLVKLLASRPAPPDTTVN